RASGGEARQRTAEPEGGNKGWRLGTGPSWSLCQCCSRDDRPLTSAAVGFTAGPELFGEHATAVEPREGRLERVDVDDVQADRSAEQRPKLLGSEQVGRISEPDEQQVVGEALDGKRLQTARRVLREQPGRVLVDLGLVQVEEGDVVLLGERPRDGDARNPTPLDQDLAEPANRSLLLRERDLELLGIDRA